MKLSEFINETAIAFAAHNICQEAKARLQDGRPVPADLVCSVKEWINLAQAQGLCMVKTGDKRLPMHVSIMTVAGEIAVYPDIKGWGKNGVCK